MKQAIKAVVVVTTSVVAIPYTIAIICNMMYGWPRGKDKYKRALHPRKVYALNYVVLQELTKVRFISLALQWNYFYHNAQRERLIKDLPYGTNGNSLDLYHAHDESGEVMGDNKPVVVFVYGGTWGSGDKSQYGLLCTQVADKLKAVVCCPNYSTYPKGYVDDMVQDIVDCLAWIQDNVENYGGNKESVMLVGHSAGAHLCVMSVLELTLKKLLHNPEAVLSLSGPPSLAVSRQSSLFSDSIRFEDKHYNGSSASNASSNNGDTDPNLTSASITGSFYVVDSKENDKSFVVLNEDNGSESNNKSEGQLSDKQRNSESSEGRENSNRVTFEMSESGDGEGDVEEVLQVEVTEGGDGNTVPQITVQDDMDKQLTQSQRDASDILASVKLVIGLAGVYHIAEHYEHEAWRGVEDISAMAKAMYGPDHFDRLSPTLLVSELPDKIKLPPMLLVHGDKDKTVPLTSSLHLGQALWDKGCYDVSVSVIPGCPHIDICVDLMHPKRQWYNSIMNELMKGAQKCL